jgi:cytosine/uracil/thiamine/allantoin permease
VRRKRILNTEDLYRRGGLYEFSRGVNWKAILALVAGCAVAFVGLSRGRTIIENGKFVGKAGSGEFIRRQTYSAI